MLRRIVRVVLENRQYRTLFLAVLNLIVNLAYAFYNGILGITEQSVLFGASCVYYLLLSSIRFCAVVSQHKVHLHRQYAAKRLSGGLLVILSMVMGLIIAINLLQNTPTVYGTIPMITIATYTFTKITLSVITAVKQRSNPSPLLAIIRSIRYAEVAVSLLTMQQSMLVSFGGTGSTGAFILNICTGAAVWLFILGLGIYLIQPNKERI